MKILFKLCLAILAAIGPMFLVSGWIGWGEHPVVAILACLGMCLGLQMLSGRALRPGKVASTLAAYIAAYCGVGFIAFRLLGAGAHPVVSTAVFLVVPPVLVVFFLWLCVRLAEKRLDAAYARIDAQRTVMDAKDNPIGTDDAAEMEHVKKMVRTVAGTTAGEGRP